MTWFLFAVVSPVLNALVNYLDKYLIEKVVEGRGIGSLIIFSALMGLPLALLILIFGPNVFNIHTKNALLIMLNGTFYVAWVLPYLYALEKDEASVVMPLFQLSSVMVLVLGFVVLGESVNPIKLLGCLLILFGAIGLSLKKGLEGYKLKYAVLLLVGISCFFISLSGVVFKLIALEESFWVTTFWESVGIFFSSLILLNIKSYRRQFLSVLKRNRSKVIILNVANEIVVIIGKLSLNFATLLAPVAVVYFVSEGFQPFFVLAFGVLISTFLPKFVKEEIGHRQIFQKLAAILVMFAGTLLISFY
jgi:uncharacterized membrane protein